MKTITFTISDEAFEILQRINKAGHAEFRDSEFHSLDEFKKSDVFKQGHRSIESFLKRNFGGTLYLLNELIKYDLIDMDDDAWHLTYKVTEFGKNALKTAK